MNRNRQPRQRPLYSNCRRTAYLRGKLLERRRNLLERLMSEVSSTAEASSWGPADIGDMAAFNANQEMLYGIGSVESDAVDQIDHALQKLDDGTYGICEDCGKRIPATRLRALPSAYLCVLCKEKQERIRSIADRSALHYEDIADVPGGDLPNPENVFGSIRGRRPA